MRAVLCVTLVLCAAFVSHAAGAVTLRGQRLIQYDAVPFGKGTAGEPGAQHYGSRTTKLRGAVEGTLPEAPTTQPLVIEASELPEDPTQLLNYVQGGLVVLLPEASTSSTVAKIRALEKVAATTQQGAVFAVPHHANTTAFRELRQRSAIAIHAVGEAPASRNLPTSKTTPVTVLSLDLVTVPKAQQVAVVAGFDTLGAFPGAPQSPASAADAAALIELATLFAPSTTPEKGDARGLSFILASGHRHSYHGVKQWLAGNGSSALQRFDTVICLESIVGEPKLTIHTARDPTKDESAKAAIDAFGGKSAVNVVVKRVDAGQSELRWAHEVFAHRGVSAVTVSAEAAAQRQLLRSTAAEADRAVDSAAVAKIVNTVAKAIQQLTKVSPSGDADATRLATTLATVNQLGNPRPSYSMPARVVPGLQQLLSTAAAKAPGKKTKVRKSEHPFAPPEAVFFSPDEVVLLVYPSVPITFELTITAAIVAALSSVAILLLGPSGFVALLKAPFTSSKKKQ